MKEGFEKNSGKKIERTDNIATGKSNIRYLLFVVEKKLTYKDLPFF